MTHTPGPWIACGKGVYSDSYETSREILWWGHNTRSAPEEEQEANARLIAKAPEMLELLERLSACVNREANMWGGGTLSVLLEDTDKLLEGVTK